MNRSKGSSSWITSTRSSRCSSHIGSIRRSRHCGKGVLQEPMGRPGSSSMTRPLRATNRWPARHARCGSSSRTARAWRPTTTPNRPSAAPQRSSRGSRPATARRRRGARARSPGSCCGRSGCRRRRPRTTTSSPRRGTTPTRTRTRRRRPGRGSACRGGARPTSRPSGSRRTWTRTPSSGAGSRSAPWTTSSPTRTTRPSAGAGRSACAAPPATGGGTGSRSMRSARTSASWGRRRAGRSTLKICPRPADKTQ
mmetsp:Transcript_120232/g.340702  ORF Transcript_120232/g.340702 Transcript_120232/m.340702 type:complete len:253 (+) Transcript_120232:388-1146(+)